jgi:hypothetical protein
VKSSKSIFLERKIYILKDSNFRRYLFGVPKSFYNLQLTNEQIRVEVFMPVVFNHLKTNFHWNFDEELKIKDNLL